SPGVSSQRLVLAKGMNVHVDVLDTHIVTGALSIGGVTVRVTLVLRVKPEPRSTTTPGVVIPRAASATDIVWSPHPPTPARHPTTSVGTNRFANRDSESRNIS
ncbi:MAG TPA: hypothetical protein VFG30_09790, partial [Polyangiales bacterium]|nr:hypothetical protein [Polyangiales bacterium]